MSQQTLATADHELFTRPLYMRDLGSHQIGGAVKGLVIYDIWPQETKTTTWCEYLWQLRINHTTAFSASDSESWWESNYKIRVF